MDLTELYEKLKLEADCEFIVRLKYRYSWEKEWTYTNEILVYELATDTFIWEDDWDEGQDEVVVLGYCPVSELKYFY